MPNNALKDALIKPPERHLIRRVLFWLPLATGIAVIAVWPTLLGVAGGVLGVVAAIVLIERVGMGDAAPPRQCTHADVASALRDSGTGVRHRIHGAPTSGPRPRAGSVR